MTKLVTQAPANACTKTIKTLYNNGMVALGKKQLLLQQKELLEILQTKHQDLYNWMNEKSINPLDLKVYSASIAMALSVALVANNQQQENITSLVPEVRVLSSDELKGKSEDEKAKLVWDRYGNIIQRNAKKYGLDEKLIFATIMIESNGNTQAIRYEPHIGDASYGLGQILYGTAKGIGFLGTPEDLFDPEVNIELLAKYHARNKKVYGDLSNEQLVTAYNTGSPYSNALPGHLAKFERWYQKASNFIG